MKQEQEPSVGFEVKKLSNQIKRSIDKAASQQELFITGVQFQVIEIIKQNESMQDTFQKDIEAKLDVRRSTVTGILQLMEKQGLIQRDPVSYDARLKKITYTEKAIQAQKVVKVHFQKIEETLRKEISEEEISVFFDLVQRMQRNIEE